MRNRQYLCLCSWRFATLLPQEHTNAHADSCKHQARTYDSFPNLKPNIYWRGELSNHSNGPTAAPYCRFTNLPELIQRNL